MLTDAIASSKGSTIKSMDITGNVTFTCPGQILCALCITDYNNINKFSVLISKNSNGYNLSFIMIPEMDVLTVDSLTARVFYY